MDVRVGLWRKLSAKELIVLNCGVGEDFWESLRLQGDPTSPSWRRSVLGVHWKDWCWSWNSNTLATLCEELIHLKRPWCWERLRAGGEVDYRGWDGWMASPTRCTWVWVNSGSWWWTGQPGVLRFMGLQRVEYDWETELKWTLFRLILSKFHFTSHSRMTGCRWVTTPLWLSNALRRRRQWPPTPVLLPGKSHGWRILVGCSPWGH